MALHINMMRFQPGGGDLLLRRFALTFIHASRYIACRSPQQDPEHNCTGHQGPSVGWRKTSKAGKDWNHENKAKQDLEGSICQHLATFFSVHTLVFKETSPCLPSFCNFSCIKLQHGNLSKQGISCTTQIWQWCFPHGDGLVQFPCCCGSQCSTATISLWLAFLCFPWPSSS